MGHERTLGAGATPSVLSRPTCVRECTFGAGAAASVRKWPKEGDAPKKEAGRPVHSRPA